MILKTYTVGPIKTQMYLVIDQNSKEAMVIDPGGGAEKIIDDLAREKARLLYILNTHAHPDHISHNAILKDMTGAKILIGENDARGLSFDYSAFEKKYNWQILPGKVDQLLKDGNQIKLGKLVFKVIQTSGHSPGGICLYNEEEKFLFSGDTLFYQAIGRTDLPFSDPEKMDESLEKLFKLPPETKVYPGHGQVTTIGQELAYYRQNAFF